MISPKTLDLFPFIRHYPIAEVLDWDLYGGGKLRWMLTDITWDELHDKIINLPMGEANWDEVDALGGERFLTSIRLVGSNLEVTIYDKEAQPDPFRQQMLAILQDLEDEGLVKHTDDEEHLIDEP